MKIPVKRPEIGGSADGDFVIMSTYLIALGEFKCSSGDIYSTMPPYQYPQPILNNYLRKVPMTIYGCYSERTDKLVVDVLLYDKLFAERYALPAVMEYYHTELFPAMFKAHSTNPDFEHRFEIREKMKQEEEKTEALRVAMLKEMGLPVTKKRARTAVVPGSKPRAPRAKSVTPRKSRASKGSTPAPKKPRAKSTAPRKPRATKKK